MHLYLVHDNPNGVYNESSSHVKIIRGSQSARTVTIPRRSSNWVIIELELGKTFVYAHRAGFLAMLCYSKQSYACKCCENYWTLGHI